MNPILPRRYYIPDVEARQWSNGRIYLYGSMDICGDTTYCSEKYHVFSSGNLIDWVDHGPSFHITESHAPGMERLYAPDCFFRNKRYHLLYCASNGAEGIAHSDNPEGPFTESEKIAMADGTGIDPAVFTDDDDRIYYFWGQFRLNGGILCDDLKTLESSSIHQNILTDDSHDFHEGASLRKKDGLYYMTYAGIGRGKPTTLAYATSTKPLGPYKKRGVLIDNTGCDPASWNNHGSMADFNGNWYLFYHRSSQNSKSNRRVCVEPIRFNSDGTIDELEMTTQGASPPIKANFPMDAFRACRFSGKLFTKPEEQYDPHGDSQEFLTAIQSEDWAAYKYLDFSPSPRFFSATARGAGATADMEVRCESPNGPLLCVHKIATSQKPKQWKTETSRLDRIPSGIQAVYLVFRNIRYSSLELLNFHFG